jgi:alkanesulfonate monooxygenase SsuD/methylene tetrahydromethanopterin reductase-like flavin-dependent oxidoreductase (luciferase family)
MAIKNFSWLYVGWVDLEEMGFEGAPVDDRRFTNEYLATGIKNAERLALLMDDLGYDALWTAEHHFQPEGIEVLPNPIMTSLHLASITKSLRFGNAFNILPQWHPLRLAEDYAMADIMTRGRVIFGIGRGTQTREVETFGSPMLDQEANRDLFEDQVELLMKALKQERFSHHSEHYTIPPAVPYRTRVLDEISLVPRPLYSTEVWQGVTSGRPRGIEAMAKHAIKGLFIPNLAADRIAIPGAQDVDEFPRQYQEAAARHGHDFELGENLGIYVNCHMGDSRAEAAREIEAYEQESFKRILGIGGGPSDAMIKEQNWRTGFKGFTMDQLQRLGTREGARGVAQELGYSPLEARAEVDRAHLFGPADEIIATLKHIEVRFPALDTVVLHPPELTPTRVMAEQIERFAKEVLPAFPEAIHTNREWPDKLADLDAIPMYHPDNPTQGLQVA